MSSASDYLETAILDHITGNTEYIPTGTLYLALFTSDSDPAELELGVLTNEVSGVNYQRKPIVFDPAVQNVTTNSIDVVFDQAGAGGWGSVEYVAIIDAFEGGHILLHRILASAEIITNGDQLKFSISNLTITIT